MSIAPSISDHIQRYMFQKANTFVPIPVPEEAPVPVHSVVAVDRHMPIITVMIGKTVINNVLLDGGSGVNVITEQERCRLGLEVAWDQPPGQPFGS